MYLIVGLYSKPVKADCAFPPTLHVGEGNQENIPAYKITDKSLQFMSMRGKNAVNCE